MNDLQKTELNILKEFLRVCQLLDLRYYLVCGSALGAVKYRGFIPWDDDIDVALPRADYERFLKEAPALLPQWCFVQNYRTEGRFHLLGTKLRDSRTTYVELMCENLPIHHGVFIDVFPLDERFTEERDQKKLMAQRKKTDAARMVGLQYRRFFSREVFKVRNWMYYVLYRLFGCFRDTARYIRRFDEMAAGANGQGSGYLCNYANSASEKEIAPAWHYGEGTMAEFEGLQVRIPEAYDAYLTQKYGPWRQAIPQAEQKGHHLYYLCDLERPYTEYR